MTNSSERIEATLVRRFSMVNDWLKYAEAKNAAFVAFSLTAAALLTALLTTDGVNLSPREEWAVSCALTFLVLASLPALASFLPRTAIPERLRFSADLPKDSDNLEFFGHLRNYDGKELVVRLQEIYQEQADIVSSKVLLDLAQQLIVNSNICWDKFQYSTVSLYIVFSGILFSGSSTFILSLTGVL